MKSILYLKNKSGNFLLLAGVGFVVYLIVNNWPEVKDAILNSSQTLFLLSILLGLSGNFGFALLFSDLIKKYDYSTHNGTFIRMFYLSQIAKYIPGKIWTYLYQISKLATPGATFIVINANIELFFFSTLINSSIGIGLFFLTNNYFLSVLAIIFGFATSIFLREIILLSVLPKFLKERFADSFNTSVGCKVRIRTILACWILCMFFAFSQFILLSSIYSFSIISFLEILSFLYISWVISLFVIIVPAGIGVKELVFIFLASYSEKFDSGVIASIAIISRFWYVVLDILSATLSEIYYKFKE